VEADADPDSLTFVKAEKDRRLFGVLDEINHSAEDGSALWRETFKDSVELKRKLAWKLGVNDFSNNYLAQAQMLNALPRLILEAKGGSGKGNNAAEIDLYVANIGSGPAEQVQFILSDSRRTVAQRVVQDVLQGSSINWKQEIPMPNPEVMTAVLRYRNLLGSGLESEFTLHQRPDVLSPE